MQTRSFSKAFRNTIVRMWWVPFLFAAIAGPVAYTLHESDSGYFDASGRIFLEVADGKRPDESVVEEHQFMLESAVRLVNARASLEQLRPEAAFTQMSIEAACAKDSAIIKVSGSGTDAELVRELLRAQMRLYMDAIESLKRNRAPESMVLDLANVTPKVLEWPGSAIERQTHGVQSGLLAALAGAVCGIVFMLLVSGLWAFFRPAWVQPSLEEIMKAADALEPTAQAALLAVLEGGASGEAGSRDAN